ncbi:hypothetical protein TNCV_951611 [Trichonephila clavipes]|nr:hypothetical protein TNCV_951611 [Trichonephila clavipes]
MLQNANAVLRSVHRQYGGYDIRFVIEWVRIPSKAWMYLRREKKSDFRLQWFPVSQTAAVAEWYRHRIVAGFVTSLEPSTTKDPPSQLIAREDEDGCSKLLKGKRNASQKDFSVTGDRFRQYFSQQKKNPNSTWRDFYFELSSYFEGWMKELKINLRLINLKV